MRYWDAATRRQAHRTRCRRRTGFPAADRGGACPQDVCELQSPPQMMGQPLARCRRHAEHRCRETAHGARDAIAIEIEPCQRRSANVLDDVHLDPVDHRHEIRLIEFELMNDARQPCGAIRHMALIDVRDLLPPPIQRGEPAGTRRVCVGNIVDSPAKPIDFEHGLPLCPRENAHGRVEGTSGRGPLSGLHAHGPYLMLVELVRPDIGERRQRPDAMPVITPNTYSLRRRRPPPLSGSCVISRPISR
jgi:hypothetical protein